MNAVPGYWRSAGGLEHPMETKVQIYAAIGQQRSCSAGGPESKKTAAETGQHGGTGTGGMLAMCAGPECGNAAELGRKIVVGGMVLCGRAAEP